MTAIQAFWAVFAVALLVCLGRAIVALVVRQIDLHAAELWAVSFIIGAGAISILTFVLAPAYRVVPAIPLLTAIVAAVCGLSLLRRPRVVRPILPKASIRRRFRSS